MTIRVEFREQMPYGLFTAQISGIVSGSFATHEPKSGRPDIPPYAIYQLCFIMA